MRKFRFISLFFGLAVILAWSMAIRNNCPDEAQNSKENNMVRESRCLTADNLQSVDYRLSFASGFPEVLGCVPDLYQRYSTGVKQSLFSTANYQFAGYQPADSEDDSEGDNWFNWHSIINLLLLALSTLFASLWQRAKKVIRAIDNALEDNTINTEELKNIINAWKNN